MTLIKFLGDDSQPDQINGKKYNHRNQIYSDPLHDAVASLMELQCFHELFIQYPENTVYNQCLHTLNDHIAQLKQLHSCREQM